MKVVLNEGIDEIEFAVVDLGSSLVTITIRQEDGKEASTDIDLPALEKVISVFVGQLQYEREVNEMNENDAKRAGSEYLYSVRDVMSRLSVSDETVYRHIRSGDLKSIKIGSLLRVKKEDLENFIKKGKEGS